MAFDNPLRRSGAVCCSGNATRRRLRFNSSQSRTRGLRGGRGWAWGIVLHKTVVGFVRGHERYWSTPFRRFD